MVILNGLDFTDTGACSGRDHASFIGGDCRMNDADQGCIGGSATFTTCRWAYLLPFTDTRFVPQDEASNPRIDRALWVLACLFSAHEPCSRKLITANAAP